MKCFNWRIVAALAAAGLGLWAIAPGLAAAALPLLVLAACPLSMLLMMRAMDSTANGCSRPESSAGQEIEALRAEVAALRAEQPREGDRLGADSAPASPDGGGT